MAEKLALAAAGGHADRVAQLLRSKADVNEKDENGETALLAAARAGKNSVVQILAGVSELDLNVTDDDGNTALDLALQNDREDVVKFMTDTPDLFPFARGFLPAIRRGDDSLVRELLHPEHGLRADVNARDKRKMPMLHHAVRFSTEEVLHLILETTREDNAHKVEVNARDRYGKTAVDVAMEDHVDKNKLLLLKKHGALTGDDVDD